MKKSPYSILRTGLLWYNNGIGTTACQGASVSIALGLSTLVGKSPHHSIMLSTDHASDFIRAERGAPEAAYNKAEARLRFNRFTNPLLVGSLNVPVYLYNAPIAHLITMHCLLQCHPY